MASLPIILTLAFASGAAAQTSSFVTVQPDCQIFISFTTSGQSAPTAPNAGFDNRGTGCTVWAMSIAVSGFSSATVALQSAVNNAGAPGTYGTFAGGTIVSPSPHNANPITTATQDYVWTFGYNPWVQVKLTAATGTGIVNGAAYGWKTPNSSANGSSGGSGTNVTIVGPLGQQAMADSVAVVLASNQSNLPFNLVQVGGATIALGQAAASASLPVVLASDQGNIPVVNSCTLSAAFNLSGSGDTQIVAASAAKKIYVCSVDFATGTPEDIKFDEGTGSNCATGTAAVTGLYKNISARSHDAMGLPYTAVAGDALCINQANAQALGGTIWYRYQ